jgi:2-methylisocitrate lyase-like PEP mutase family enzyme
MTRPPERCLAGSGLNAAERCPAGTPPGQLPERCPAGQEVASSEVSLRSDVLGGRGPQLNRLSHVRPLSPSYAQPVDQPEGLIDLSSITRQRVVFRALHESGCFVIPNPWDIGTVRVFTHLGFRALATTSAGFSFARGLPDSLGALSVDAVLVHIAEITSASDLPVNADFQSGYATDAQGVATNVRRCVDAGVAGLSIEDTSGAPDAPLFDLSEATERVRAARGAIDASGADVLLTARAECFLVQHPDPLRESVRRLQAYADAGADVLYAPGPRARDDIRAIVESVHPKPVNVLMAANTGLRVADLAELGVRRVSVGSALARAGWGALLRAARQIAEDGSFAGLDGAATFAEMNSIFENEPAV